eukprot:Colp12_sorted_trinity150504_noHs@6417
MASTSTPSTRGQPALFASPQLTAGSRYQCGICYSILKKPVRAPCGHVACRECFLKSIDTCNNQCPFCRKPGMRLFMRQAHNHIVDTALWNEILEAYPSLKLTVSPTTDGKEVETNTTTSCSQTEEVMNTARQSKRRRPNAVTAATVDETVSSSEPSPPTGPVTRRKALE